MRDVNNILKMFITRNCFQVSWKQCFIKRQTMLRCWHYWYFCPRILYRLDFPGDISLRILMRHHFVYKYYFTETLPLSRENNVVVKDCLMPFLVVFSNKRLIDKRICSDRSPIYSIIDCNSVNRMLFASDNNLQVNRSRAGQYS